MRSLDCPFAAHRDSVSDIVGNVLESAIKKVIAKKAGQAVHVLDRFHVMAHLGKAPDKVRAAEVKELKEQGQEPVLTRTRWLLLKRPGNLSDKQESKLAQLAWHVAFLRGAKLILLKNLEDIHEKHPQAKQ